MKTESEKSNVEYPKTLDVRFFLTWGPAAPCGPGAPSDPLLPLLPRSPCHTQNISLVLWSHWHKPWAKHLRFVYNNVPLCLALLCPRGGLATLGSPGCLQCRGCLGCLEHLEALAHLVHPEWTRGWKTRMIKWDRMTQTQVEDKHKVRVTFFFSRFLIIPPIDWAIWIIAFK